MFIDQVWEQDIYLCEGDQGSQMEGKLYMIINFINKLYKIIKLTIVKNGQEKEKKKQNRKIQVILKDKNINVPVNSSKTRKGSKYFNSDLRVQM